MSTPTARAIALEAVRRVTDEGAYSNRVIPGLLASSGLDVRDRAFAADLAYGTLRRLIPIDRALDACASRPVARMSPAVRAVVRLGAFQLLFGGVAPYAAVAETVELATPKERGFANAVLRRVAADPPPPAAGEDDAAIGARVGLQRWAVTELRRLLGDDEVERAAEGFAAPGPLSLRANTCVVGVGDLESALRAQGRDPRRSSVDPDGLLLRGGEPTTFPGFERGWFAVQDEASMFVVRTLDPQPGDRVLDGCAAPGGKALFASCLAGERGLVVASDVSPGRLGLIGAQARRLGSRVSLLVQDATSPAVRGPFDRILVDAPCSGIGSARRRPELLWRGSKDRLATLARKQVAIAAAVADLLEPGGRLVYSVCTFPRAETDAAVSAILRHRPDLRQVATDGPDGPAPTHRLWPHRHGTDGMFVAVFERLG